MECLKLIASPNFPEKRIGYLALMLLLDERTEVLTLVTNSLKNDLHHESQYVVGLALTSVGNLATADMGRVLVVDVSSRLTSSNPYIRKKAALALIRILKRVPELAEDHIDGIVALIKDRSHGVLIAAMQLMADVATAMPGLNDKLMRVVPSLVKMLRNLLNLGYSPEHDISGIADPFLQVKLLRILAVLGKNDNQASEAMNDILAQVATNTETNRNAGNAILYECVKAIMNVESETGLKVLAINILGRFLLNRDNNIRYVALNSLSNVVNEDVAAVQRHRSTILDCLKDPDVSIRQRALELTYQLVDANNVVELVREMLNYLVVSPPEHRTLLCNRVSTVVDKYAPSARWHAETLITMLSIAGNYCDNNIACATVNHIAVSEPLHGYATHKLFRLLQGDLPRVQTALLHVAVWCIGEFGDHLCKRCTNVDTADAYEAVPLSDIVGLLGGVLNSHLATTLTKSYVLTALMKLACRLQHGKPECQNLIANFILSLSLELQQRSCEYISLFDEQWGALQHQALARMPATNLFRDRLPGKDNLMLANSSSVTSDEADLLHLVDVLGRNQDPLQIFRKELDDAAFDDRPMNDADLLSDIFAGDATPRSPAQLATGANIRPDQKSKSPARTSFKAFEKNGLRVIMDMVKETATDVDITCSFLNLTCTTFDQLIFQAAVPKYISMELTPASATTIPANNKVAVTQSIKVRRLTLSKPLMMRLKVSYWVGNHQIVEQEELPSFPVGDFGS